MVQSLDPNPKGLTKSISEKRRKRKKLYANLWFSNVDDSAGNCLTHF